MAMRMLVPEASHGEVMGMIAFECVGAGVLRPLVAELERREKTRYRMDLPVRYHRRNKKDPTVGVGQTLNVSSNGALVAAPNDFQKGERLELYIDWPERLGGQVLLQLVTVGKVVRRDPQSFAMKFQHHEFRTRRSLSDSPVN